MISHKWKKNITIQFLACTLGEGRMVSLSSLLNPTHQKKVEKQTKNKQTKKYNNKQLSCVNDNFIYKLLQKNVITVIMYVCIHIVAFKPKNGLLLRL